MGSEPRAQLVDSVRKGWREDFSLRFAAINGLPGVVVHGLDGSAQTATFEIEGDVIRAPYVVRNPDKLRHLAAAPLPQGAFADEQPCRQRPSATPVRFTEKAIWPPPHKAAGTGTGS